MMCVANITRRFSSINPVGNFRSVQKSKSANSKFTEERAFSYLLIDTVCEAVGSALGRNVLEVPVSKRLLDNSGSLREFDRELQSLFGDGASVLERLVVKDPYRKLSIPYESEAPFDYEESLITAREVCRAETSLK